tara:strand:+ start:9455 stop:10141 length:687 start_codon:yes stop_codon:yes gene_type:complete
MTGFLASIKNIDEAKKISNAKIDIVDLKNVDDGALGFVGLDIINKAKQTLQNHKISVTLGNNRNPNNPETVSILSKIINQKIEYIKIGLFDKTMIDEHKLLLEKFSFTQTKPICVLFADKTFDLDIMRDLINMGYQGIMIDTVNKDSKSMTEILKPSEIKKFISINKKNKTLCGLSGSLKISDINNLKRYDPDFLGFRGQLCSNHTDRSEIDINLLKQVSLAINSSGA